MTGGPVNPCSRGPFMVVDGSLVGVSGDLCLSLDPDLRSGTKETSWGVTTVE